MEGLEENEDENEEENATKKLKVEDDLPETNKEGENVDMGNDVQ